MIRYTSERQLALAGFTLPFGGKLNPGNRWVKLGERIAWDGLAKGYHKKMSVERVSENETYYLSYSFQTLLSRC